jgi:hypothetical protein
MFSIVFSAISDLLSLHCRLVILFHHCCLSNPPVGVAISFGVLCALAGESESLMYPTELFENTLSASLTAAFRRPAPGPPPAALPEIVPVAPPVVVGLKVLDFM